MTYDYPFGVTNIRELMRWFDRQQKEKLGQGIPSHKFPIIGGVLKRFKNNNDLTIDELRTLVWGVMNENPKTYSPVYAKYHLNKLDKYMKIKEDYEEYLLEKSDKDEIEFNSDISLNEEEDDDEEFFKDL